MLQIKKIFIKILSVYFSAYILFVPAIILTHSNDLIERELKLIPDLSYKDLTEDNLYNVSFNQNQYLKQIRSFIELRVKINRSDLHYATRFYQILTRLYSGKHRLNLNSARPSPGPEISPTISRSPPLFS